MLILAVVVAAASSVASTGPRVVSAGGAESLSGALALTAGTIVVGDGRILRNATVVGTPVAGRGLGRRVRARLASALAGDCLTAVAS